MILLGNSRGNPGQLEKRNVLTSGKLFHVVQAVLISVTIGTGVVSHPVTAWKTRETFAKRCAGLVVVDNFLLHQPHELSFSCLPLHAKRGDSLFLTVADG